MARSGLPFCPCPTGAPLGRRDCSSAERNAARRLTGRESGCRACETCAGWYLIGRGANRVVEPVRALYAVQESAAVSLCLAGRAQDARKRRRTGGDGAGNTSGHLASSAAILARSGTRGRGKEKPRTSPGRGSFETLGGAEEDAEGQEQDEQNISHAITSNVKTEGHGGRWWCVCTGCIVLRGHASGRRSRAGRLIPRAM